VELLSPPAEIWAARVIGKTYAHGLSGEEEERKHQRTESTKWPAYSIAGVSSFFKATIAHL